MRMKNYILVLILGFLLLFIFPIELYAYSDSTFSMNIPKNYTIFGEGEGFLSAMKKPTAENLEGKLVQIQVYDALTENKESLIRNIIRELTKEQGLYSLFFTSSEIDIASIKSFYWEQDENTIFYFIPTDNKIIVISFGNTAMSPLKDAEFTKMLNSIKIFDTTKSDEIQDSIITIINWSMVMKIISVIIIMIAIIILIIRIKRKRTHL